MRREDLVRFLSKPAKYVPSFTFRCHVYVEDILEPTD